MSVTSATVTEPLVVGVLPPLPVFVLVVLPQALSASANRARKVATRAMPLNLRIEASFLISRENKLPSNRTNQKRFPKREQALSSPIFHGTVKNIHMFMKRNQVEKATNLFQNNARNGEFSYASLDSKYNMKNLDRNAIPGSGTRQKRKTSPLFIRLPKRRFSQQSLAETSRGRNRTVAAPARLSETLFRMDQARISSSMERLIKRSQLWRRVADIDSSNAATSTRTP